MKWHSLNNVESTYIEDHKKVLGQISNVKVFTVGPYFEVIFSTRHSQSAEISTFGHLYIWEGRLNPKSWKCFQNDCTTTAGTWDCGFCPQWSDVTGASLGLWHPGQAFTEWDNASDNSQRGNRTMIFQKCTSFSFLRIFLLCQLCPRIFSREQSITIVARCALMFEKSTYKNNLFNDYLWSTQNTPQYNIFITLIDILFLGIWFHWYCNYFHACNKPSVR